LKLSFLSWKWNSITRAGRPGIWPSEWPVPRDVDQYLVINVEIGLGFGAVIKRAPNQVEEIA
jgi:hypothetical protein